MTKNREYSNNAGEVYSKSSTGKVNLVRPKYEDNRDKPVNKQPRRTASRTENVVSPAHPFKTVTRWSAEIENALNIVQTQDPVEINFSTTVPALLALMHVQSRGHVFISSHEVGGKCLFGDIYKNTEGASLSEAQIEEHCCDPSSQIMKTCQVLDKWLKTNRLKGEIKQNENAQLIRYHYQYDMVEIGTAVSWLMVCSQTEIGVIGRFGELSDHKDLIQHLYKKMAPLWVEYSKWYKGWVEQGKPMFRGYVPVSGSEDGETEEEEFMLAAHRCQHFNTPFGDRVYATNLELVNLFSDHPQKESVEFEICELD